MIDPATDAGASPPVLFIVFNRLDTAREVMRAIAAQRPARLYIAADGPRPGRSGEQAVTRAVRDAMVAMVDWPCELRTLFQEQNLGCRLGVKTAIDWFFTQEPEGIILEDDVVPSSDFFQFTAEMLELYRDDPRVMMVSGTNPLGGGVTTSRYFFSSLASIWGWATWRTAWHRYDVDMAGWNASMAAELAKRHGRRTGNYFKHVFDFHRRYDVDTWDTQWTYTLQAHDGLGVMSEANLIRNIGVVGTHSSVEMRNHHLPYGTMVWPVQQRSARIENDLQYRDQLTREILQPAMRISVMSQMARKFGIHGLMKAAYRVFRTTRSSQSD